jgi:hypothetical protein
MSKNIDDLSFSSSSLDAFFRKASNEPAKDAPKKLRVASRNDVKSLGMSFVSNEVVVRISKQDFWKLGQDDEGHFVERLVSDDDGPIKG